MTETIDTQVSYKELYFDLVKKYNDLKDERDYWKEQYRRCNEGYISHGYRITGDNYFFLNFYRLKDISTVKIAGSGRKSAFPSFYAKQYEYFHYIEICKLTGHDVCALKARGVKY